VTFMHLTVDGVGSSIIIGKVRLSNIAVV
jgi:hypothetical protein